MKHTVISCEPSPGNPCFNTIRTRDETGKAHTHEVVGLHSFLPGEVIVLTKTTPAEMLGTGVTA